MSARKSGTYDITTHSDGHVETKLVVVQNGRGPQIEASLTLAADGTLASFRATGRHEMGTKVDETFSLAGERATWKSEEESGSRTVSGPTMYLPMATAPIARALLVQAALRNNGSVALLPSGKADAKLVTVSEATVKGERRQLSCYAITGLGLSTEFTWMNKDGSWFGSVSAWMSVVPEGWESVIEPLVKLQQKVERDLDAELAKTHAKRPPAAGVAYTNARVLDVAKKRWLADHTVVVVGDTITAVGPTRTTKPPAGAEVVDLEGKAILPGLIDMHAHLGRIDGVLNIASGVTTVRDVGNDPDELDDLKARFDAGTAVGPHVVRYGFVEGRGAKAAAAKVTAETVDEATAAVELYAKRGYEGIKIYNSVKTELVPHIAKLAHAKGMQVIGHIPVHMLAHEAVTAGYDGIEHINMLFLNFFATKDTDTRDTTRFTLVGEKAATLDLASKPVKDFFAQLKNSNTIIDPTLSAFEDLFVGVPGKLNPGIESTVARLPVQTARGFLVGGLPLTGDLHTKYRAGWDKILAMVKALHVAKIPVVLGTDHIGGVMLHHEMELFVRAGISAGDVLELATMTAARAIKLDAKIGSIAKGKRADLVIVDGDPLARITDIGFVVSTMRGGVVFPSAPLYRAVGVVPVEKAAVSACKPEERFDRPANNGSRFSDGLRGKTGPQVLASHGEPTWCKSPTLWRYTHPSGCSYERTIVSLWFTGAKVTRTTEVTFITGEHCL